MCAVFVSFEGLSIGTSVVSDAALAELDNYMSGVHQPDNVADSIAVIARANGFNLLAS